MFLPITISISNNNFSSLGSLCDLALDCSFDTLGSLARDAAYSLFNDALWCLDTINAHQLGLKDYNLSAGTLVSSVEEHTQCAASWDRAHVLVSITKLRRNGKSPLLANAHVDQVVIPSAYQSAPSLILVLDAIPLDDASLSNNEAQWLSSVVAGVELLAI
jgi:hypothetical protein